MADHLHPAIDIPVPGIWRGASVRSERDDLDGTVVETEMGLAVYCQTEGDGHIHGLHDFPFLDLTAPDGLGLAGLAGRVCQRMGWFVGASVESVSLALADQPWCSPEWEPGPARVREAATLLARLDRLVAATWPDDGIVLAPGTVPDWRRDGAEWVLTVGPVGCARYAVDVLDPIEAAGAALEAHDG